MLTKGFFWFKLFFVCGDWRGKKKVLRCKITTTTNRNKYNSIRYALYTFIDNKKHLTSEEGDEEENVWKIDKLNETNKQSVAKENADRMKS